MCVPYEWMNLHYKADQTKTAKRPLSWLEHSASEINYIRTPDTLFHHETRTQT